MNETPSEPERYEKLCIEVLRIDSDATDAELKKYIVDSILAKMDDRNLPKSPNARRSVNMIVNRMLQANPQIFQNARMTTRKRIQETLQNPDENDTTMIDDE